MLVKHTLSTFLHDFIADLTSAVEIWHAQLCVVYSWVYSLYASKMYSIYIMYRGVGNILTICASVGLFWDTRLQLPAQVVYGRHGQKLVDMRLELWLDRKTSGKSNATDICLFCIFMLFVAFCLTCAEYLTIQCLDIVLGDRNGFWLRQVL